MRPIGPVQKVSVLLIAVLTFGVATLPAWAQQRNLAEENTPIFGSLSRGDLTSTHSADGSQQRIAEAKEAGQYHLEWQWRFTVAGAASYRLDLLAQATNSRQGMDHYQFEVSADGGPWQPLGLVDQTTMTQFIWDFPAGDFSGPVTVRAVDSNRTNDGKRSNQLWIDEMVIVGTGDAPTPLGAPSDLHAPDVTENQVGLAWDDNSLDEEGFRIERRQGEEPFQEIGTSDPNVASFADTNVTAGETYDYRVLAFQGAQTSEASNILSVTVTAGGGTPTATGPQTDKVIVGYYPSWGIYNARKYWISYIPFESVTHVYYAFADIDPASHSVVIGDSFADETNRKDPETDNGLPAGNLHQLTHFRDIGHNGPAQEHLKVIISVGGWTWSHNYSQTAKTAESRGLFAESLKTFVATYDLDGADINWEFPTGIAGDCGEEDNVCDPLDPINHALLIMACRLKLDELGQGHELSIAAPVDPVKISRIMPPLLDNSVIAAALGPSVDIMVDPAGGASIPLSPLGPTAVDMLNYIHVMNYDMAGASWDPVTRHHAPLFGFEGTPPDPADGQPLGRFNSHHALRAYQYVRNDYSDFDSDFPVDEGLGGVPPEKLTFGVPMYGRGWKSVDATVAHGDYPGLFQFSDGSARRRVPKGTWDGGQWGNSGVYGFWDILLNYGGDGASGNYQLHDVVEMAGTRPYGPYVLGNGHFIGFDNQVSIGRKMGYLVDESLGGVMFWDLAGDLSKAQVVQGQADAGRYPGESLIHHLARELEVLSPSGN